MDALCFGRAGVLYALVIGRMGFGLDHAQLRAASKGRKKTMETTLPWAKVKGK